MQIIRYAILAALLAPSAALACEENQTLPEIAWFNVMETYDDLVETLICDAPTPEAVADRIADLAVQTGVKARSDVPPNS